MEIFFSPNCKYYINKTVPSVCCVCVRLKLGQTMSQIWRQTIDYLILSSRHLHSISVNLDLPSGDTAVLWLPGYILYFYFYAYTCFTCTVHWLLSPRYVKMGVFSEWQIGSDEHIDRLFELGFRKIVCVSSVPHPHLSSDAHCNIMWWLPEVPHVCPCRIIIEDFLPCFTVLYQTHV